MTIGELSRGVRFVTRTGMRGRVLRRLGSSVVVSYKRHKSARRGGRIWILPACVAHVPHDAEVTEIAPREKGASDGGA